MTKGRNCSSEQNKAVCNVDNIAMVRESLQFAVTRPLLKLKVMETDNQLVDIISKMTINDLDISNIVTDFENIKIEPRCSDIDKAESDSDNDPEASNDEQSEHSETDVSDNHSGSEDENNTTSFDKKFDIILKKDYNFSSKSSCDNEDCEDVISERIKKEDIEPYTILDNEDENNTEKKNKEAELTAVRARNNDKGHGLSTIQEGYENELNENATLKERYDSEDNSEKEEEEKYLKRGLLTHNKPSHRFSPIQNLTAPSSHSYYRNNDTLTSNHRSQEKTSNVFDIIDFNDTPKDDFSSQFQLWQNEQMNGRTASQEYPDGLNQSTYQISSDTNLYQSNTYQMPQYNDWNTMPSAYPDNGYDYSHNSMYQPPTPPTSVSPMLKETFEGNLFDSSVDNYNVKKSEDLINIINAINLANKTEPSGIPEAELEKLRSVLESNDDSIRNEMDMYLAKNDDSIIQQKDLLSSVNTQPTNILEDVQDDCKYWFDGEPLTPPSSIPPAQDGCSSPAWEQDDISQLCSEEHLSDIINGIEEINPDELNIYLEKEKQSIYDTSYAKTWLQKKCKPNALDYAFRRLSQTSNKVICKKDKDGDTGLMIVYSQPENSSDFYENIFCMQEIVLEIKVCCEVPLGKAKRCKSCGNSDPTRFYTPLSLKNNQGYSALCCAVKTNLSTVIVDYLIDGILKNEEDVRRVFDAAGRMIFAEFCNEYPSLKRYI